ncbi:MAG: nitronate monooxygenase [Devosia sp.]|uniref:NAD(P)H-dependent flavin oxidoreductase n=1 Tax=Devosia sp. TaxID=1871048 RepID=UPI001AC7B019|nr:nitronate monooxygenase [Devosia sp.]MBN9314571.1 nitronate monooxygenase [Devosia sp.]
MKDLADNPLCHMLGCSRPIVLAGMGGVARSELVAAVAAAGGFGFLGMVRESPELIAAEVGRLRRLGIDRFGVNIIPAATGSDLLARQVETLLALRVPAVTLFWDIDTRLVRRLREAGILVVYQVGSVAEAVDAERAGAQVIIAQGCEAGGHVRGATPLQSLLPAVAGAVQVPVLAAGGLSTGGDLIAALSLGAEGIVLGTALLAAEESFAHDHHKHRLLAAKAGDTLLTETFHINWPHGARVRVLASAVTAGKRGREVEGERVVIGDEDGRPIYLFSTDSPLRSTTGDLESMALYAGTGVGMIHAIRSARAILDGIVAEAEQLIASTCTSPDDAAEASSSVCYAGEMGGTYMGMMDAAAAGDEAAKLAGALAAVLAQRPPRDANAPPFSSEALDLSPRLLALTLLAGGRQARTLSPPMQPDVSPADLSGRIGLLSARVPEGALRTALVSLRSALERTVWPDAGTALRQTAET